MYFSPVFKHYFIMKSQCETIQCIELLKLNTQYTPPTCHFKKKKFCMSSISEKGYRIVCGTVDFNRENGSNEGYSVIHYPMNLQTNSNNNNNFSS